MVSPVFILILLPLVLFLIHIDTPWEIHLHFFQIAILFGAYLYGPTGGGIAGAAGSFAGALMLSNPYLIVGNVIWERRSDILPGSVSVPFSPYGAPF